MRPTPSSFRLIPFVRPFALLVLLCATVCAESSAGVGVGIVITGGNPQSTPVGTAFALPLSVRVVDIDGYATEGEPVEFSVNANDGADASLAVSEVTTDANGNASTTALAGAVAGTYTVTARLGGGKTGDHPAGVVDSVDFALTNLGGDVAAVALPAVSDLALLLLGSLLVVLAWRGHRARAVRCR